MTPKKDLICPDCDSPSLDRRTFLGAAAAVLGVLGARPATAAPSKTGKAETLVGKLYETLTENQRQKVCFSWDHHHKERGLLRTHVSNNWHITEPSIKSEFYTKEQQSLVLDIFKSIFNPDWHERLFKQLRDDSRGEFGQQQNIAIFGKPGDDKFEFVMTGRHMTIRCDGNTEKHVALGGPIFHGHAASGFNEKVGHPGNVFWHQAKEANKIYQIMSGKQQKQALITQKLAEEWKVGFQGKSGEQPGIPIGDLSKDQIEAVQKLLLSLVEPYRKEDQDEIKDCLKAQGGLEACHFAFYQDKDLGNDMEWDNWRIEGPSFVWNFRGTPHVHIWINVADDPSVKLNSKNL